MHNVQPKRIDSGDPAGKQVHEIGPDIANYSIYIYAI